MNDSPELLSIPARYRLPAYGLWTAVGVWMSKQHELFCPMAVIKKLGGTQRLAEELHASGLLTWDVQGGSGGLAYTGRKCRVKALDAVQAERVATADRVRAHRAKRAEAAHQQEPVD